MPEQSAVGERLESEAAVMSRWHIERMQKYFVLAIIWCEGVCEPHLKLSLSMHLGHFDGADGLNSKLPSREALW